MPISNTRPFLVPLALLAACGAPVPPTSGRVEPTQRLRSTAVGADYDVIVRLPPSYDAEPTRRYPVVYQLDARFLGELETMNGHASELERTGAIPEVIVVGVSRSEGEGDPAVRTADFAPPPLDPSSRSRGRADLFLSFLTEELGPRIDATYRTDPARRALSGHSLAGLFALYAFFSPGPTPYFTHVLAGDPSTGEDRGVIFGYESALAEAASDRPGALYLTAGRFTGAVQIALVGELGERLASRGYPGLRLRVEVLDTDHGGAIAPTMIEGLVFALGGTS